MGFFVIYYSINNPEAVELSDMQQEMVVTSNITQEQVMSNWTGQEKSHSKKKKSVCNSANSEEEDKEIEGEKTQKKKKKRDHDVLSPKKSEKSRKTNDKMNASLSDRLSEFDK